MTAIKLVIRIACQSHEQFQAYYWLTNHMAIKVLVTGAAGFVGMHVSLQLLKDGHNVVGHDNLNAYYAVSLKEARLDELQKFPQFEFIQGDLADQAALNSVFRNNEFEVVYHLGAQAGVRYSIESPNEYVGSNLVGFLNILECCRHYRPKHLVFASSSSVYGDSHDLPYHEHQNTDRPVSLYAATKKSNELMAHAYAHLYGLPVSGLRFFTVYGPWGRPDMAVWKFTEAIIEGTPIQLFANGKLRRDFTYIRDIVEGVTRVGNKPPTGMNGSVPYRILNIGNHSPVMVNDVVSTLEDLIGRRAIRMNAPPQQGDVEATFADTSAIHELVNFRPSTPLETGLKHFVEWYRDFRTSASPNL